MVLEVKGVYHNIIWVSKGGAGIRIGDHVLGVDVPARTIRGLAMFATFLSSHNYDLKGTSFESPHEGTTYGITGIGTTW